MGVVEMSRILTVLMLAAGVAAAAQAAPSSNVAWTADTMALLDSGDPERGATLVDRCASCHGEKGVSVSAANPSLAGQLAPYTYKQLMDYKDGKRSHGVMRAMARPLSEEDMADIAAFYASQPVAKARQKDTSEIAETLVTRGDGERLIPACGACHGRSGMGNVTGGVGIAVMPVLVGQYPDYIADTLRDYRSGDRANDIYWQMRSVAGKLTDEEIEALARHYGTLGDE